MWFCICYYVFTRLLISSEVITLKTDRTVTCVLSHDSVYSALDIVKLKGHTIQVRRPIHEIKEWVYNDWTNNSIFEVPADYDVVSDPRWEYFDTTTSSLELKHKKQAFSVCIFNSTKLYVNDSSRYYYYKIITERKNNFHQDYCHWFHGEVTRHAKNVSWTLNENQNYRKNRNMLFLKDYYFLGKFKMKIPKYDLLYSSKASVSESLLLVDLTTSQCIFMYVSIDKNCYLDIRLEVANKIIYTNSIVGFNKKNNLKKWQKIEIKTDAAQEGKLYFRRHKARDETVGYWAIDDIQFCKPKIDIYRYNSSETLSSEICRDLEKPREGTSGKLPCSKPHLIGQHCNITCEQILGKNYSHCQGHKICLDNYKCYCAWGYQGKFCNETCPEGYWGFNCSSKCHGGCKNCDNIQGCMECHKDFDFRNYCSEQFPVVETAPVLTAISGNSVEFIQNLEYGKNKATPEFYMIQYKKDGEDVFHNDTKIYPFTLENRTFKIRDLPFSESVYKIRTIFIIGNRSFGDNVPEATVYATAINASYIKEEESIELTWSKPPKLDINRYKIEYEVSISKPLSIYKKKTPNKLLGSGRKMIPEKIVFRCGNYSVLVETDLERNKDLCTIKFCSPENKIHSIEMNETNAKINGIKDFNICTIDLSAVIEKNYQLISQINLQSKNSTLAIVENEMPDYVTIFKNKLVMNLQACDKFSGPLTYNITYKCTNKWCNNDSLQWESFSLNRYQSHVNIQLVELRLFSNYSINVTASRFNHADRYKATTALTPLGKPFPVRNFSVYCKDDKTLWLRWKDPYPPTGVIEKYKITYKDKSVIISSNTPCELWDDYNCANIREKETLHNLTIQAKNYQVSDLSKQNTISVVTKQKASEAPENLRIESSKPNEIILTWRHPFNMNSPLEKFCVRINNGDIRELPIKEYKKKYSYAVTVEHGVQYNISVWGKNKLDGEKSTLRLMVAQPIPEFSPNPLVEWCSRNCYLMFPTPNNIYFNITVTERHSQKTRTVYLSSKKKLPRTILTTRSSNSIQLEIGDGFDQIVSMNNQTHHSSLMFNNKPYPIKYQPDDTEGSASHVIIITTVTIIIVTLLISFLFYRRHKRQTSQKKKNIFDLDHEELVPITPDGKFGSNPVNVEDFENYVSACVKRILQVVPLQDFQQLPSKRYVPLGYRREDPVRQDDAHNILLQQFRSLPESSKPTTCALQDKNEKKNKDKRNVPYDCSRVILTEMEEMGTDDYINASYIDGYDRSKAYIATQGPKFFTINDFWRMIWQQNVGTIVMATNFYEGKKRKCAEYFPQEINTIFECKQMSIKFIEEEAREYYDIRTFEIIYKDETRRVQHLKLKWNPDDSMPFYPNYLTALVKRIRIIRDQSTTPIVIHCSSGVKRTATLILCDLALQMVKIEKFLDFYTLTKKMRDQRPNMVSSEQQYILAHLVILECLMEEENIFRKDPKDNLNSSVLKAQLKYLEMLGTHDETVKSWTPQSKQCYETSYSYVMVDGYAMNQKFMVTKQPTQKGLHQFWDIVVNEKIQTILFLNKTHHQIFPYVRQDYETVVKVQELESTSNEYYTFTKLLLQIFRLPRQHVISEHKFNCVQLHGFDYNPNLKNMKGLLTLLDDMGKNYSTVPMLVACRNGETTSGLYLALSYIIQKYRSELEVDVCSAVRIVRRSGTKFIKNKGELEVLYKATIKFLENFDSYDCAV